MPVIRCPECGKVISLLFPYHNCKPVPKKKQGLAPEVKE